jgi:anti-anti-sigma factor
MLSINETVTGDIQTLELTGRLDVNTSDQFQEALDGVIAKGAKRLVIDCAGLDYVSSSGLRVFILAGKKFKSENGRLTICGLSAMIRKVFDVSGLSSILEIASSRDEAVTG